MKNLYVFILGFLFVAQSCVDRIDIPVVEDQKLVLDCSFVAGQEVRAKLMTTDNLNGTTPISFPGDALISFSQSGAEVAWNFIYDAETKEYFLHPGQASQIKAGLPYEIEVVYRDFPLVTADTRVPKALEVADVNLLDETTVQNAKGEVFFKKTIELILPTPERLSEYFMIEMSERRMFALSDSTYSYESDHSPLIIGKIISGVRAIKELSHRPGILIDYKDVVDNRIAFEVVSNFPIISDDQVFDEIDALVYSLSKPYYDYEVFKSNRNEILGETFHEEPIFPSNLRGGIGVFSSASMREQVFTIK